VYWLELLALVGIPGMWPMVIISVFSQVSAHALAPDDVEFTRVDGQANANGSRPNACLLLMARDRAMKPDWMMAATCAAVEVGEPRYCAPEDWVCVAAGALGGKEPTCASLPEGLGRRACLMVSGGAVPDGACLRGDDATSCASWVNPAGRREKAALERLERAWDAKRRGDVRGLAKVCDGAPNGLEDKVARCACLEWLRPLSPVSAPRGCPRCEKSRGESPLGRCPVRVPVARGAEGVANVENPWSSPVTCWAEGRERYRLARLEPGMSQTRDDVVNELWCLPVPQR
jgi:hypothetical protein